MRFPLKPKIFNFTHLEEFYEETLCQVAKGVPTKPLFCSQALVAQCIILSTQESEKRRISV
jgi:hypothetical protein